MANNNNLPTLRPFGSFSARRDAKQLHDAMKGLGTDEETITMILCRRSQQQRLEIGQIYREIYGGKDLAKDIADDTSGHYGRLLLRLIKTPEELAAYELANAGSDDQVHLEIFATKTSDELRQIQAKYQEMYPNKLEQDILSSLEDSSYFRRFMVELLKRDRPVDTTCSDLTTKRLFKAVREKDDNFLVETFCQQSFTQLGAIFEQQELTDAISLQFSKEIADTFLPFIAITRNRAAYFAGRLNEAISGAGTNENALSRIIVMHCETDLGNIKTEFAHLYKRSLWKAIQAETSGDFKRALLTLIVD